MTPTSKTTTGKTDPYDNREWSIGNAQKFIGFDWCDNQDGTVIVHSAVCSSNKRGMVANFLKATVPVGHAEEEARQQVAMAWEWLADKKNVVKMTVKERKESDRNGEAFIRDIRDGFIIDRRPYPKTYAIG